VFAPAWAGEPQILSSAIPSDPLWALLFRRAIEIVNADLRGVVPVVSNKRFVIELMDDISWDFLLQKNMCFREVSSENLQLLDRIRWSISCQERTNCLFQFIFGNVWTH
jgi:hypothetical protein